MSLWTLRYRKPQMVTTDLIDVPKAETSDAEFLLAQRIGQTWCDKQPGFKYIGVQRAVVADVSILGEPVPQEPAPEPIGKPTPGEQRQALKERGPKFVQPSVHENGRVVA